MKKTSSLTAPNLRIVLLVSIAVLIVLSGVGFWFFTEQLRGYAAEVRDANAAATTSSSDVARLEQLETQLEDDKIAVTRAKNIVADSKYYQYQDQIISDLTSYAKSTKVQIMSIDFEAGKTTPTPGAAATPAAPAPAGLKSISASVTLKNPADYKGFLRFVHAIELNLTKMQISGISIQRDEANGGIVVNPLTVEVYTR